MDVQNFSNVFIFLSELLRRPVRNKDGRRLAVLYDIIIKVPDNYPEVVGYLIKRRRDKVLYVLDSSAVEIRDNFDIVCNNCEPTSLRNYDMTQKIRATMDLIGHKIIDTRNKKVVRIYDLHLLNAGNILRVAHIDISLAANLRMYFGSKLLKIISINGLISSLVREELVSWRYLNAIPGKNHNSVLNYAFKSSDIMDMHPAELADIIEELDRYEQEALFKALDHNKAAETLSELEDSDVQKNLLESVGSEKAADLLEEMPPDEAVDILQEIDEEKAETIINKMENDDAEIVKELIKHEEDTAGGLMTTEFVTLPEDLTAEQAIDYLRVSAKEAETIYYVYVVDKNNRLKGTVSLKRLIISDKNTLVSQIMTRNPVYVCVDDEIDRIAHVVSKYNLLAIPVVDKDRRLKGVITLDDLFEIVIKDGWKKKLGESK
ncbi:MAG: CBS domain-containing protein [Deltaproteobacteria bacterium]|nr:CBS domain-containing protein [Deltaproteobacteria bacterium]